MSYIGNQPSSVAFLTDTFNGTGSQTAFTLSAAPAGTSSIIVAVSGVLQDPSTYAIVGTTLNFSAAPPSGTGNISVRFLGIPASGVTTTAYRTVTEFTATAGQTTFTPPSYTVGFISVFRNGVLLGAADYTATNGTTVVLAIGATSGDLVTVESFNVSSVLNAIPASPASVGTSYLVDGSVTTAKIQDNAITTAKIVDTAVTNAKIDTVAATKLTGTIAAARLPAGTVLQVVQVWKSDYSTISTNINVGYASYPTIFSGSITPSSASNKILVLYFISGSTDSGIHMVSTIKRAISGGATSYPALGDSASGFYQATTGTRGIDPNSYTITTQSAQYLDSPNTTSAITYSIIGASENGNTWEINSNGENYSGQSWSTRFASGMIMMEIGG